MSQTDDIQPEADDVEGFWIEFHRPGARHRRPPVIRGQQPFSSSPTTPPPTQEDVVVVPPFDITQYFPFPGAPKRH